MMSTNEQFTDAFRGLDPQRQSEIFVALTEIMANSNPELMEMITDQIEAERGGDWWDKLTERDQQRLEQSMREAEEGKMVSHETSTTGGVRIAKTIEWTCTLSC